MEATEKMSAYLGGFDITNIRWGGTHAIIVTVSTDYTDRYFQLYAGRRLIGITNAPAERDVIGQLARAHCPHPLTVVMVSGEDRLTDFGAQLPKRPFNQFHVSWTAETYPADATWFEITACTEADGAIDPTNVITRIAYIGDGDYEFTLPPINAPGTWSYRITPRDDAVTEGNATEYTDISADALPYPPDVATVDGQRLTATIDAGVLTVTFAFNWDEES